MVLVVSVMQSYAPQHARFSSEISTNSVRTKRKAGQRKDQMSEHYVQAYKKTQHLVIGPGFKSILITDV